LKQLQPCPWEVLSHKVLNAVLNLGKNHPSLRGQVLESVSTYVENCTRFAAYFNSQRRGHDGVNGNGSEEHDHHGLGSRELSGVSTLATSLLGFLEATARNLDFWTLQERWQLIRDIDTILSDDFLTTTETALSTIRHSMSGSDDLRSWKQYQKNYAVLNRPIGAMLLRESFMYIVAGCSGLLITTSDNVRDYGVLATIMSQTKPSPTMHSEPVLALVDVIATISARETTRLEEGSDYLQLGSAWQQRLAHSVKALAFMSFLCCALINEEAADPDVLMLWLDASLADSSQSLDPALVTVVLRSMAILSTLSPATAATLGRSLPRTIVKTPLPTEGAVVAADALLFVLKQLPSDMVITTLYGLGNALSARNGAEAPGSYALFNDLSLESHHQLMNGLPDARGSTANLLASIGAEHDPNVYNAVIQAIVRVATGFNDSTVTALALSMLIQKVGKISMPVDLKIIQEAAILSTLGGAGEFRAVLRLYMRLSQQALAERDHALQDAVSSSEAGALRMLTSHRFLVLETCLVEHSKAVPNCMRSTYAISSRLS
jgi:phosphatidylinositol 4-kinase